MFIRFVILIFFLIFGVHSDDKNINEQQIKNIIEINDFQDFEGPESVGSKIL